MSSVLIIKGYNTGVRFKLKDITTIGRADDNSIVLPENSVSRYHAEIVRKNLGYAIRDKDSKNGVYINSSKINDAVLLKNDEIQIGNCILLFDSELDLQNAVFSNRSLVISPEEDETIRLQTLDSTLLPEITQDEKFALELIQNLSELFSEDLNKPKNEILYDTIAQCVKMFKADRGILFLFDAALNELKPMVIFGEDERVVISSRTIRESYYEKKSLLYSGTRLSEPNKYPDKIDKYISQNPTDFIDPQEPKEQRDEKKISLMSAPMLYEEKPTGIIIIEKDALDFYTLKDLRIFQSVAKIISAAIARASKSEAMKIALLESKHEERIIGTSDALKSCLEMVSKVAAHNTTILITGETGTGKELFAREIHNRSPRKDSAFIALNCSAVPPDLFESEFFGHEKGAFTGAIKLTPGKAELAHGGTLFLDEIGDLPINMQPKILRFFEEKVFYRVGGVKPVKSDVRLIAATNRNLEDETAKGNFRRDLLYRLSVLVLTLPPLRERKEDIRLLAEYFQRKFSHELKKNILGFSDEAIIHLQKQKWLGNIRELANCIERATILAEGKLIEKKHLLIYDAVEECRNLDDTNDLFLKKSPASHEPLSPDGNILKIFEKIDFNAEDFSMKTLEKNIIISALLRCDNNQIKAAKMLNIHRNTLANKIKEYEIKI